MQRCLLIVTIIKFGVNFFCINTSLKRQGTSLISKLEFLFIVVSCNLCSISLCKQFSQKRMGVDVSCKSQQLQRTAFKCTDQQMFWETSTQENHINLTDIVHQQLCSLYLVISKKITSFQESWMRRWGHCRGPKKLFCGQVIRKHTRL